MVTISYKRGSRCTHQPSRRLLPLILCVQRVFWILIDVLMFLLVIALVVDILCHRLLATYIDILLTYRYVFSYVASLAICMHSVAMTHAMDS